MRQKRAKAYRKLMQLYSMSFGFRQPYQVLVDSEMCTEAATSKIDLAKQLATVLQGSVKPMITQCCIHSLYLQGQSAQHAVDIAKTFERRRCNHRVESDGKMKEEIDCLCDVVGQKNTHRYVVASQSSETRQKLRLVPGVPLVHSKRSVMVLEPVSDATEKVKKEVEEGRLGLTKIEASAIAVATNAKAGPSEPQKKKHKGPKGPNPLSVKKKKPKDDGRRQQIKDTQSTSKNQKDTTKAGPRFDDVAKTGEKRKRLLDVSVERVDISDTGSGEGIDGQGGEGIGRKRRRRRKNAQGDGALTAGDGDGND